MKNLASSLFVVSLSVDAPSPNVSLYDAAPCTLLTPDDAITAANAITTTCHVVVLLRRATMMGAVRATLWREKKAAQLFWCVFSCGGCHFHFSWLTFSILFPMAKLYSPIEMGERGCRAREQGAKRKDADDMIKGIHSLARGSSTSRVSPK